MNSLYLGTIVCGCSRQNWCGWEEYLKWIMFLSSKKTTVRRYSSIATLVRFSDYVPILPIEILAIKKEAPFYAV